MFVSVLECEQLYSTSLVYNYYIYIYMFTRNPGVYRRGYVRSSLLFFAPVLSQAVLQAAMQVATGTAHCTTLSCEQLRRWGKRVTISIPNATTARDLRPT